MAEKKQVVEAKSEEPRTRKWLKPTKRAAGYAEELRKGVHMRGDKAGQELDKYNRGFRSGYLLAQSDNTGMYKYKKARSTIVRKWRKGNRGRAEIKKRGASAPLSFCKFIC